VDPWSPWTEQRPVVANVDEALEVGGDALPHVVVKWLLFGTQFCGWNDRQAHGRELQKDKATRQSGDWILDHAGREGK
jgi:hypothetical protein